MSRKRSLATLCAALCFAVTGVQTQANAQAQSAYPCPLVKIVSPYPPGGTTDILARLLAPGLNKEIGSTVIVDNKGGANGNIGTQAVIASAPDGCTLLLGNNAGVSMNRNFYKLQADPVVGLAPVIEVAAVPMVLYVNAAVPANSVKELIELIQKNPGKYSFASGGNGSAQHLLGELMKLEMKLDMTHVPYRGQGPALADVMAGQVTFAYETLTAIAPQLKSGRVRVLATTGNTRAPTLPDTPTMKELGYPNFVVENWYGVFAPAKTPPALVTQLNRAVLKLMKTPEIATALSDMSSRDVAGTPEQFATFIKQELPFWESLAARSGVKAE